MPEVFETGCEVLEVTSNSRPDTSWRHVDHQGHRHVWHADGKPADRYNPSTTYETPTLVWVKDGEACWEDDDEPHDVGHLECRECGAPVRPGYTADTTRQYIPGLRWFTIDGRRVTPEEYEAKLKNV